MINTGSDQGFAFESCASLVKLVEELTASIIDNWRQLVMNMCTRSLFARWQGIRKQQTLRIDMKNAWNSLVKRRLRADSECGSANSVTIWIHALCLSPPKYKDWSICFHPYPVTATSHESREPYHRRRRWIRCLLCSHDRLEGLCNPRSQNVRFDTTLPSWRYSFWHHIECFHGDMSRARFCPQCKKKSGVGNWPSATFSS